jgi:hypothetical protein
MFANITISVVEQWHGEVVSELKESKTDDFGDEDSEEKVEKEVYFHKLKVFIESYLYFGLNLKKVSHPQSDFFISEFFATLPDLPPEA